MGQISALPPRKHYGGYAVWKGWWLGLGMAHSSCVIQDELYSLPTYFLCHTWKRPTPILSSA